MSTDGKKQYAAIKYAQANKTVADSIKTALALAPGSTAEELTKALQRTHDITHKHVVFMLYGLRLLGTIKPVGIGGTHLSKKWALADSKLEASSIDIRIDTAILEMLKNGGAWMSVIRKVVADSIDDATEKEVIRELHVLVKARRIEPVKCRFTPGELYPDIMLINPTTKTSVVKLSLANLVVLHKLEELKSQGIRQIEFVELAQHFSMTKIGLRKHLDRLHLAGSIHVTKPGSGRSNKIVVTLDLSLLRIEDIKREDLKHGKEEVGTDVASTSSSGRGADSASESDSPRGEGGEVGSGESGEGSEEEERGGMEEGTET